MMMIMVDTNEIDSNDGDYDDLVCGGGGDGGDDDVDDDDANNAGYDEDVYG